MEEQYRSSKMAPSARSLNVGLPPQLAQISGRYCLQPWWVQRICDLWADQILECGSAKLRNVRCRKSGTAGYLGGVGYLSR